MTYLLLRDNKQSGPYSLEDLKTKGLKAYDLVWVDGRSAAWRYPSEIAELSAFAPAVEEQPFDRFYKKPAAVSGMSVESSVGSSVGLSVESSVGSSVTSQSAIVSSGTTTLTSQPFYSEDQSPTTRKRTIYVTMPGGTAAPVSVRETVREAARETTREPIRDTARETPRETVRPAAAALPIGDYAGELMPRSTPRHRAGILQPILIGVGILVLLAGGIFIGLSINRDTPGSPKLAAGTTAADNSAIDNSRSIAHTTTSPLPVPSVVSSAVTAPQTQPANTTATTQDRDQSTPNSLSGAAEIVAGKTGKIAAPKPKAILPRSQAGLPSTAGDSSTAGIPVIHRTAEHRTEADNQDNPDAADKGAPKVNLASQVSVGANKYEVGTFGGISNLQVTVANRSTYPLDLVVVEVQYIQANKKTYKTENLYFHGVGPGMALMQEAPKSSRGIKVEYKITLINSKELGLSESGL
jgi:hypothetical protein